MNAPVLTVRYDGPPRTFAAGNDVVVGRDLRADVRITHPLVSRAHVVLRFIPTPSGGHWAAIDNGSLNGLFVHGRRVPEVDIVDGTTVNLGNPDGPPLSFELGHHQVSAGRPPQTPTVVIPTPAYPPPAYPPPGYSHPDYSHPVQQPSQPRQYYPPTQPPVPPPGRSAPIPTSGGSVPIPTPSRSAPIPAPMP